MRIKPFSEVLCTPGKIFIIYPFKIGRICNAPDCKDGSAKPLRPFSNYMLAIVSCSDSAEKAKKRQKTFGKGIDISIPLCYNY